MLYYSIEVDKNLYRDRGDYICDSELRVREFLNGYDVDTEYIKSLDASQRNHRLIEAFSAENCPVDFSVDMGEAVDDSDVGVLFMKPEIAPCEGLVMDFLESQGFETKALDRVYPSHDQWMNTYGYMIDSFPDVINIYIAQRSLGLRPVLFHHLSADQYQSIAEKETRTLSESLDKDSLFDQLFCGQASDMHAGTIRGDISFPVMRRLGFDDMSGYASMFDPVDYFKDTGMVKNYRAYNGVHIPSNAIEKRRNIDTLLFSEER